MGGGAASTLLAESCGGCSCACDSRERGYGKGHGGSKGRWSNRQVALHSVRFTPGVGRKKRVDCQETSEKEQKKKQILKER